MDIVVDQHPTIVSSGFSSDPNSVEQETPVEEEEIEIIPVISKNKSLLNLYNQLLQKTSRLKLTSTLHNEEEEFETYNCSQCDLPVANFFRCIDQNQSDQLLFETIYSNIETDQYEELISIAKSRRNWPMYLRLLLASPRLDDRFLFMAILTDDPCLIIEQSRIKPINESIQWENCLKNLHCQLISSTTESYDRMIEQSDHRCRLCLLRMENNRKKLIEFFEKTFLLSSLFHCHSDIIINELIVKTLTILDLNPENSYAFSIDFYIRILCYKIMDAAIVDHTRLLINKFSQRIKRNDNHQISGNIEKNFEDCFDQIIVKTMNTMEQKQQLELEQQTKIDSNKTMMNEYKNKGMMCNLRIMKCNHCDQSLLSNDNVGNLKIRKKLKIFPNCRHIFHDKCLITMMMIIARQYDHQYCPICFKMSV